MRFLFAQAHACATHTAHGSVKKDRLFVFGLNKSTLSIKKIDFSNHLITLKAHGCTVDSTR
jgi:hypothetical protein